MPVSTETQLPNLSSTLVERLARREMERGEGRSGLKTRLRRWVGTSTSRRRPRESRPMEERGHHIEQEVTEQLKLSIDSGIDLEPLSRMPTTRSGMEEEAELGLRSANSDLTFDKEEVRRQEVDFLLRRTEQYHEVG